MLVSLGWTREHIPGNALYNTSLYTFSTPDTSVYTILDTPLSTPLYTPLYTPLPFYTPLYTRLSTPLSHLSPRLVVISKLSLSHFNMKS